MQKSNIWPSFTLIINCIHFWFSHPTVRVSRRQFRIWSNMVSHNFYSGTPLDISTQVRTNCFSGLAGDSARDCDTHLEAADARVPAHVVGAKSARAAGARHQPLLEVGPRADHGPGGLGLGPHGVVCGVTGYGHNIRVSVSPHSRRISEKLTPCAALQAEMSLAGRTVLCTVYWCTVPRATCTALYCTVQCTVHCHLPRPAASLDQG